MIGPSGVGLVFPALNGIMGETAPMLFWNMCLGAREHECSPNKGDLFCCLKRPVNRCSSPSIEFYTTYVDWFYTSLKSPGFSSRKLVK